MPSKQCFELIIDYSEIDKIDITVEGSEHCEEDSSNPPVRVWINDRLAFKHDYTLHIDSFFNALNNSTGSVSFIGECGIRECCAVGFFTESGENTWRWGDFTFSWDSIYQVADQIIFHIEALPKDSRSFDFFKERLNDYRLRRDAIKLRGSLETSPESH